MGNNKSIELTQIENGIIEILNKDVLNYPISYFRLCWDNEKHKYGIPETCDVNKDFSMHRKIIVVGMNLPESEKIHEQVFYLSSGLNSIKTLEKFFKIKLESEGSDIWIPFLGFGYPADSNSATFNKEKDIKLLKNNFDCLTKSENCSYGRFGNWEPNLMQISYCLGGKFWDNNVDKFIKKGYNIEKYQTLTDFYKEKEIFSYNSSSDVECSIYLNNYIASALVYNYAPFFLKLRKRLVNYAPKNEYFDYNDLKMDFRIINILNEKKLLSFTTPSGLNERLPFENNLTFNYWNTYIVAVINLFKKDKEFFIENIVPLITEVIPIFPREVEVKIKSPEKIEYILGSINNPYKTKKDAKKGEYYRYREKIIEKK